MILALAARGKKIFASLMLAVVYLEIIIPLNLTGAPLPVRRIRYRSEAGGRMALASPDPVTKKRLSGGIPAVLVAPGKTTAPLFGHTAVVATETAADHPDFGGPTQPEMQAFHSANNSNMVDLFTGDLTYNIPLMDVDGYPVTIGYNSGSGMDAEASWVGLGWNFNPGTVTRNLRGIPDDFNGHDSIRKELSIRENKTVGVSVGGDLEIVGLPVKGLGMSASVGVFKNTYTGWGLETGFNASISAGGKTKGPLTGGLSITNNSKEGLSFSPSLNYQEAKASTAAKGGYDGNLSVGTSYNSRGGLRGLQVSGSLKLYEKLSLPDKDGNVKKPGSQHTSQGASMSFAFPGYTPTINIPYTNEMTTVTLKLGGEATVVHPSFFVSGYVTRQYIAPSDKKLTLPAFGYLNYQAGAMNQSALMDFNREKEIPFRDKPAVPNIAVPSYTYDIFTISGEGTGGNFRAYRNDIGYVYDHKMTTRDHSLALSGDLGYGAVFHAGVDIINTKASTTSASWANENPLASLVSFRKSDKAFEAAYFRNPGEMTINANSFYDALGGDRVVTPKLYQDLNDRGSNITSTNKITPYERGVPQADIVLNSNNVVKPAREKRTQSITYLTAKEASEVGLSKYIENYALNKYPVKRGNVTFKNEYDGAGDGLMATYYPNSKEFGKNTFNRVIPSLNFDPSNFNDGRKPGEDELISNFSATYTGKLKIPRSGVYYFRFTKDDGFEFYLNGEYISGNMDYKKNQDLYVVKVNMEGGKEYDLLVRFFNAGGPGKLLMEWKSDALGPNPDYQPVPANKFYLKKNVDSIVVGNVSYEKRIDSFRKENHISEIDVLNSDGRRYIYGIPVYNLSQKEVTFSLEKTDGNSKDGLAKYRPHVDDTTSNSRGRDHYYSGEFMPPYAHSYLLTGIVTPDYTDLTGNGISDDDPGNAIRFNYTKIAGYKNPYLWRSPASDSVTYNEGMKTDSRDDKGSFVAGSKELWYLNSIESKNMIAVFKLGERADLKQVNEVGVRSNGGAKRLEQIDLYTKADFQVNGTRAKPVKTVHFDYTYELCKGANGYGLQVIDTGKLTLKRIWFSYNGNEKGRKNPYVFNYNKLNPTYATQKYDGWGNYKDPLQNPGSSASDLITNAEYPYPLQDSALAAQNAAAWALDSIIMPSGGRIKINYESDDYAYVQNKRAMQMCRIAGFSWNKPSSLQDVSNNLYSYLPAEDNRYVAINVPYPVTSKEELYARYLDGVQKLYFRLSVKMPTDKFGGGYENVPCYATIDESGDYGFINNGNTIWLKIKGIDKTGMSGGPISPLLKAAAQFLKFNLPSKAYPGSDTGDDFEVMDAVKILVNQADNVINTILSFEESCRGRGWVRSVDLSRSVVRMNNPIFKKYGGGHRVKSVITYDYWNKMTGQRESSYGMEYNYTTTKVVNGETLNISSGVAAYEPVIGGEENPWHMPIEYLEQVSVLAPVNNGYTEEPLGESFFPAPSIGYSKVRVRTINAKKVRSANGFNETCFYTTKDFPTLTERTPLNDDTKKRFKSPLGNILKINVKHFLTVSQGFKIEINDMNGRIKSSASYAETDPDHPIAYTENFYKVDDQQAAVKHLNNSVLTINPKGNIAPSSIGKDIELMLDMREERSLTNAVGISPNTDIFTAGVFPIALFSLISLPQRDENRFRSVAATKLINRHGILDSVVVIDKGSKIVTHNLLFDTESGEPVLTSVQNEYNDSVFNFNYPAGWIYEGMSGAYKNVGVVMDHIDIKEGRIIAGLQGNITDYFFTGDELLVDARRKVAGADCAPEIARWPVTFKIWVVDANILKGGAPDLYFVNEDGSPLTGNDISLKIIRSGRKNIAAGAGGVTMLRNPLQVQTDGSYKFVLNAASQVVNASVTEYKESWKVPDRKKLGIIIDTFRNEIKQRTFTIKCNATDPGKQITITVPVNTYKSVLSLADANNQAEEYLDYNGQYLAKQQVQCNFFYSVADSAYFRKSSCGDGVGETVLYKVKARADSSLESQAAANALARARLNAEGQAYANSTGRCVYYNTLQSGVFRRTNCPNPAAGSPVTYTLPAKTDSSYTSVADANAKTLVKINANGPAYANVNGFCDIYAKLVQSDTTIVAGPTNQKFTQSITSVKLTVYFYVDEACTVPYNMPSQQISILKNGTSSHINKDKTVAYSVPISEVAVSYTVSGSSTLLGSRTDIKISEIFKQTEWDPVDEPGSEDRREFTYKLANNSAFIIKQ